MVADEARGRRRPDTSRRLRGSRRAGCRPRRAARRPRRRASTAIPPIATAYAAQRRPAARDRGVEHERRRRSPATSTTACIRVATARHSAPTSSACRARRRRGERRGRRPGREHEHGVEDDLRHHEPGVREPGQRERQRRRRERPARAISDRPQRKTGTAASDITSACSAFSSEYPSARSPRLSGSPATAGTTAL